MAAATSFISSAARRLEGKVALITGGAGGIGATTARVFAHHGAKIVIADLQDEVCQSIADKLGGAPNATYVHCDVTDESQVKSAVDAAVSTYGKLDVMFNNAGTLDPKKPSILENEKADFERVLGVNVSGVFLGMKHAARVMIPRRAGSIISTASISSAMGGVTSHAYTCSKHAVLGLTRNAAVELGQFGIRVNCLAPSTIATPMPMKFLEMTAEELETAADSTSNLKGVTLKTEDIANAALFLASEEARYVSGENLFVDGGFSVVNSAMNMFK